jgi:hypothetical protein
LDCPRGNIFGGGGGVMFTSIGHNQWTYTSNYSVDAWSPAGTWTWSQIQAQNAAQETSAEWSGALTFQVRNSFVGSPPVLASVTVQPSVLQAPGVVSLVVVVNSTSPVNSMDCSLDSPIANIYGGGGTVFFTSIGKNQWKYTQTYSVDQYAPSGTWKWSDIQVQNAAQFQSLMFPHALTFQVKNNFVASKPVIVSVTASPAVVSAPGVASLVVVVNSTSPVNFLDSSLDSPKGNVFGGGGGVPFTNIGKNQWTYTQTTSIDQSAPVGTWKWSAIQVQNAAGLESVSWSKPLTFVVKHA